MAVDEGPKRLAAAFPLAGRDGNRRPVAEPDVAVDVVLPQRLFQPADVVIGKLIRPPQGRPRIPDEAGVDQQRAVIADPLAGAAHQVEIEGLGFPHRLPAEFDRAITRFAPAAADLGRV